MAVCALQRETAPDKFSDALSMLIVIVLGVSSLVRYLVTEVRRVSIVKTILVPPSSFRESFAPKTAAAPDMLSETVSPI